MRRTNLPGHALRSEGKPYVLKPAGSDESDGIWERTYESSHGVGFCECGKGSGWMTSDNARKRWHRDVHKPEVRAALGSKENTDA